LSEEAAAGIEPGPFLREPYRRAGGTPSAVAAEVPSRLSVWAGFLVSGVALFTALVMTFAVWLAPELTLGLSAIVQVLALVGATLGAARLLQSPKNGMAGLEKAVATASAMTAPLTLGFLLAIVALLYELEFAAFLLPGFVGGAWMHAAWLGTATTLLWLRGGAAQQSQN